MPLFKSEAACREGSVSCSWRAIAPTGFPVLEQPGFTEYGLPVIVPRDDVRFPRWIRYELAPHPLWIRLNAPDFQERVLTAKRIGSNSMRSPIAAQLLRDLKVDYAATGAD
jgi:hypothetical protein